MGDKVYFVRVVVEEYDVDEDEVTRTIDVNNDGLECRDQDNAEVMAGILLHIGQELDDNSYIDRAREAARDEVIEEVESQHASDDPEDSGFLPLPAGFHDDREPTSIHAQVSDTPPEEHTGFAPATGPVDPGLERLQR